jgi:hypothetical protein
MDCKARMQKQLMQKIANSYYFCGIFIPATVVGVTTLRDLTVAVGNKDTLLYKLDQSSCDSTWEIFETMTSLRRA